MDKNNVFPDIYEFQDYKVFLLAALSHKSMGRGSKSRLAQFLGCGSAFVSQILQGSSHLSLEHGIKVSEFLKLNNDENHFFVLMLQKNRSGSKRLEKYFQDLMNEILQRRELISARVGKSESLNFEDQNEYYSSWFVSAIHVMFSIPEIQNRNQIAEALGIPPQRVQNAIDFLTTRGLLENTEGSLRPSNKRIHLNRDSPMILKHHNNWRLRALQCLEANSKAGLHFSGVWSFSRKDVDSIKKVFLNAIENAEPILRPSPEETVYGVGLDFFPLLKTDLNAL